MNKLSFLLLLMISTVIYAVPKNNEMPPLGDPVVLKKMFGELIAGKPQCELELTKDIFFRSLNKFKDSIDNGNADGTAIKSIQIVIFAEIVNNWTKQYKYIELDTNVSKTWFIKVSKIILKIYDYSKMMDIAEKNKDNKTFEKYKALYNNAVDVFTKELKKPEKPDRRIVEQLHIQKIKEHRQYQEYIRKLRKEEE